MSNDLEQLQTIKSQTLTIMANITANPKPTYSIDGQNVAWSDYLDRLRMTIDWCDKKLSVHEPFEIRSQGAT